MPVYGRVIIEGLRDRNPFQRGLSYAAGFFGIFVIMLISFTVAATGVVDGQFDKALLGLAGLILGFVGLVRIIKKN